MRVPANNSIDPGTEHPIAAPSSVESIHCRPANPDVAVELSTDVFPVEAGVLLKATPDVVRGNVHGSRFVVETTRVPGKPDFPHCQTAKKGPNVQKLTKAAREPLSEDTVVPIHVEMDGGVLRATLESVEEG